MHPSYILPATLDPFSSTHLMCVIILLVVPLALETSLWIIEWKPSNILTNTCQLTVLHVSCSRLSGIAIYSVLQNCHFKALFHNISIYNKFRVRGVCNDLTVILLARSFPAPLIHVITPFLRASVGQLQVQTRKDAHDYHLIFAFPFIYRSPTLLSIIIFLCFLKHLLEVCEDRITWPTTSHW